MSLELILDFRSPYSYLAREALKKIGMPVTYTIVDALDVMKRVGNQPSQMCPPKVSYAMTDVGRSAKQEGLPFAPNMGLFGAMQAGKIEADLIVRVGLAAQSLGQFEQVGDALFALVWAGNDDVVTAEGRVEFSEKAGVTPDIWALAAEKQTIADLHASSERAAERGIFGVPTMFLDGEMFFGNDRMPLIRERLRSKGIDA